MSVTIPWTDCTCGHSEEEHGNSPINPRDRSCDECPCAAFERDTSNDEDEDDPK